METTGKVKNNPRFPDMGGSLPVPNVQALAASRGLNEIPQRYFRPEIEDEFIVDGDVDDGRGIPVLDMHQLLHPVDSNDEMIKFKEACQNWGFFQLTNHGVSDEVIDQMKSNLEEFFGLALEEKQKVAQPTNNLEGYGQAFVVSEDQKLDWGDMFFLSTLPDSSRNMKLWPELPKTFRDTLDRYSKELKKVSDNLLELMAKDLGLDQKTLTDLFSEGRQSIRMNYYPPCPQANKALGLSPHSDAVGLTLLIQANEIQGLQIKRKGKWLSIKPLPGAFIVNIGDLLEIITNGKYKSIEHRAIVNPVKERLSIAAFHNPNIDLDVGPLDELVKENRKKYRTLSYLDFLRLLIASKLDGKGFLNRMKFED